MQTTAVSEPYQQTVGAFVVFLRTSSGSEPSIPSKIAGIVLKLLDEKEPPLRQLIGPDAIELGDTQLVPLFVLPRSVLLAGWSRSAHADVNTRSPLLAQSHDICRSNGVMVMLFCEARLLRAAAAMHGPL
ncbi:Bcboa17 [Penicillium canescens]|nr:Bcboa17 [Penicillium canescens]